MLTLSMTTSLQKQYPSDCITLYKSLSPIWRWKSYVFQEISLKKVYEIGFPARAPSPCNQLCIEPVFLGLYRILIWPDIRSIILQDTGYPAEIFSFQQTYQHFWSVFYSYFILSEKVLKKVCSLEFRIICLTVLPDIRPDIRPAGYPADYPANETGYPAGYRISKKAGYPVQPYFLSLSSFAFQLFHISHITSFLLNFFHNKNVKN